jgi:hypothetical protein
MIQLRYIGILLQVSIGSLVTTFVLSLIILFVATLPVTQPSGSLYNFIFGSESRNAPEFINAATDVVTALTQTVFGNETVNKVLFFILWLLLGTVVYLISASISNSVVAANNIRSELHYMNLHKEELKQELGKRVALHVVGVLNWLFYSIFFFRFLLPYSAAAARIGIVTNESWQGWLYLLLSICLLMISLHLHVVLLRFILLRPRMFGGWETNFCDKY